MPEINPDDFDKPTGKDQAVGKKGIAPEKFDQPGVMQRLWEGLKMGWGEGKTDDPVKALGGMPSRMAYRGVQGLMEGLEGPGRAYNEGMPTQPDAAVRRTLPTAMLMAGAGGDMRLPRPGTPGAVSPQLPEPQRQVPQGPAMPRQQPTPAPRAPVPVETVHSPLSRAIAGSDGMAVDRTLASTYHRAIRPSKPGGFGANPLASLRQQDRQIVNSVDQIIANRRNLNLTTDRGVALPSGSLPKTIPEFAQALDQTKRALFAEYRGISGTAQQQGLMVPAAPAVQALRAAAAKPALDVYPAIRERALRTADDLEKRGSYAPQDVEDMLKDWNHELATYWQRKEPGGTGFNNVFAPAVDALRKSLDKTVETAGPQYQALRNRYGAIRQVETDLGQALLREVNNLPGGVTSHIANLLSNDALIRGFLTLDPDALIRGGGWRAAKMVSNYINSPNRAVARMFQRRAGENPQVLSGPQQVLGGIATSQTRPDLGPNGGKIIARRPAQIGGGLGL